MVYRLRNVIKFQLERALLRGALSRLLVIALLIALVSLVAGALVYLATPGFKSLAEAIWWAFLRLSDPGYLGDDQGALKRTVSTVVTILGYVLFMGSMIAIMTQWLTHTLRNLERGFTPIAARNHLVILGWSNRTVTAIQEIVRSQGRVQRFMRLRGIRRLRLAVLAEDVTPELRAELAEGLGPLWNPRQTILRTGDPLRMDHLRRVDFANAAAILLPGREPGRNEPVDADTQAIKTLLSIASSVDSSSEHPAPLVVAEIHDAREIPVARRLYSGPVEFIASGQLVGRLMAQTIRHPGLSYVTNELLRHDEDNEIYLRDPGGLAGRRLRQLFDALPDAIPLGVARASGPGWVPLLGLDPNLVVQPDDRLVLVARSYDDTAPGADAADAEGAASPTAVAAATPALAIRPMRRVLVLGWNHRVPALLSELGRYANEQFEITVVSQTAGSVRDAQLDDYEVDRDAISVQHRELDATNLSHLRRLEPAGFDNVVLVASSRADDEAESDARTTLSYLLLQELLPEAGGPRVAVELAHPDNAVLFETRSCDVVVSPVIVSHMLAQVALRRELRTVFDQIFGADGPEIVFFPARELGLAGEVSFGQIQQQVTSQGLIALGVRLRAEGDPRGGVALNPPRTSPLRLGTEDDIVVLRSA